MYRARIDSPFGPMLLCGDGRGLAGLYFVDQKDCPPLPDGPGARPDSLRPGSGEVNGVLLRTLRASRRVVGGRQAGAAGSHGQLGLFSPDPSGDDCAASSGLFLEGASAAFGQARTDFGEPLSRLDASSGFGSASSESLELLQNDTPAVAVALFTRVREELQQYFSGVRKDFDFPLALSGTPFQLRVWRALRQVPYAQVASYGQLAKSAGLTPGHGRPVGAAVGRNPISIVVPCHRIIGSNRALTGYTGGLSRKLALLELEGFEFGR